MPADVQLEELLEAIRENGPEQVVKQYKHNLLPSRLLIDLYSDYPELDVLRFLALYPTVPSQVLEDLTDCCFDPAVQAAAATNPRCSQLMLVRMAQRGGAAVRKALAANRFHSPKITGDLLRDPSLHVRVALAKNSAIQNNCQTMLAIDEAPAVRAALATVARLPEEILHTLSVDTSAVVRACVFARSKASPELLAGWAQTESVEIQRLLLTRSNLPPAVQRILSCSSDPVVQEAMDPVIDLAAHTLLARAESELEAVRLRTAQREDLPEEIQHVLASDPLIDVRVALASNPAITPEIALCIATSHDRPACLALAENPNLPAEASLELCHHELDDVRLRMAYRNDLTVGRTDILVNRHNDINLIGHLALRGIIYTGTSSERCAQLLEQKAPSLRRFAAASELLTPAQKRALINDPAAEVRLALCRNKLLTEQELTALKSDWNADVAAAAKTRLETRPARDEEDDVPAEENKPESNRLVSQLVRFFKDEKKDQNHG
jgi:hypothetical protein